jgi:hypothetical protein
MITGSQDIQRPSRWLFELQDDGTVTYSSPHAVHDVDWPTNPLLGRNLFEEFEGFEDMSEVRKRFRNFVRGRTAADSFHVKCVGRSEPTNAKIVMTRTFETGYSTPAGMVMFEIREEI